MLNDRRTLILKTTFVIQFFAYFCLFNGIGLIILRAVFNKKNWVEETWGTNKRTNKKLSYRSRRIIEWSIKTIGTMFSLYLFWGAIPYWEDTMSLLMKDIRYIEGFPSNIYYQKKDFNRYVVINDETYTFGISPKVEMGKWYKIAYLPHTRTAINFAEVITH